MSEFVSFVEPPDAAIKAYDKNKSHADQSPSIPEKFLDAISVREKVFVDEQRLAIGLEFDQFDHTSYHWIAYASVGNKHGPESHSTTARKLAIGTVRLTPPPHPPHPEPSVGTTKPLEEEAALNINFPLDANEAHVRLGRLAVLQPFRRMNLSRLLINAAQSWVSQNPDLVMPAESPTVAETRRLNTTNTSSDDNLQWKCLMLVHAQTTMEQYWKGQGFVTDTRMGQWIEDGLPHVGMWKRIELHPRNRAQEQSMFPFERKVS